MGMLVDPYRFGSVANGLGSVSAPTPAEAMAFWNLYPVTYSGPCLQVLRVSDSATQDIYFDGSGYVDTAAIASFCGASDGKLTILYDQTDGSDGITHETTGGRCTIYTGSTGQMVTDGTGNIALLMNNSNTPILRNAATSANFGVMCRFETSDTQFAIIGNAVLNNQYIGLAQSGSSSTAVCNTGGSLSVGTHYKNGSALSISNRGDLYTAVATGSPVRYFGAASYTVSAPNYASLGQYQTPGDTVSMNSGKFSGYVLRYDTSLTGTQIAAVDTYLASKIL